MKKEPKILLSILVIAYVLRILPYLLGYPIPITDDSLRDFRQVIFLMENKHLNLSNPYGAFPFLHILIYSVSLLGISPLKAFLFVPQLFAAAGIFFFYLFLRKYFPKEALFATFLIAVFSPHIYWTSQPVRETIGLFFFPLIIFLFDREISGKNTIGGKIGLLISFLLIAMTHHWSAIMALFFLVCYSIFFKSSRWSVPWITLFLFINLLYWFLFAQFVFQMIAESLRVFPFIVIFAFLALWFKSFDLNKVKKHWLLLLVLSLLIIYCSVNFLFTFEYPLQTFINPLIIFFLFVAGILISKRPRYNNILKIVSSYLVFPISSFVLLYSGEIQALYKVRIDPLRTLEFVIFPLSILAAHGFLRVNNVWKRFGIYFGLSLLVISGILIYPSSFIFGRNFGGTPFYDVRGDIRYIPKEGFDLIQWANEQGYSVLSNNYVMSEYQQIFYPKKDKEAILVSEQDYRIEQQYSKIRDVRLGIPDPAIYINKTATMNPLYSNSWGTLYSDEPEKKCKRCS